jgi:hypothetical protein
MEVYTYYVDIESNSPNFHSQNKLLSLWGESWAEKGFTPIVLNVNDAKRSLYYERFLHVVHSLFYDIIGSKMSPYGEACWMRWLAFSALNRNSRFIVCDYDVINNRFPVPSVGADNFFPKGFTIWHGPACPAMATGNSDDYLNVCKAVEKVNPKQYKDWLRLKNYKDFHDQTFFHAAFDCPEILCEIGLKWAYLNNHTKNSILAHFEDSDEILYKQLVHVSTKSSHASKSSSIQYAKLNLQQVRQLNVLKLMGAEVPIPQKTTMNTTEKPTEINKALVKGAYPHTYNWTSPKKLTEYTDNDIRNFMWYSKMELRPGVYTESFFPHKNSFKTVYPVSLIRHLMENMGIRAGHRCLDFGTMNAVLPILLAKRGAEVVTQDSMPEYYATVNLAQEAYGTNFEYLNDISIYDLRLTRADKFDVVLFCGIMYHLINPLIELAIARSFLSLGGLMLIETQAILGQPLSSSNFFGGAVFGPSVGFLEQICRILCLKPIDVVYLKSGGSGVEQTGRVAFVCRAVESPAMNTEDANNASHIHAFYGKLVFSKVNGTPILTKEQISSTSSRSEISYDLSRAAGLALESERYRMTGDCKEIGIDLHKSILNMPNAPTFVKPREILTLADTH